MISAMAGALAIAVSCSEAPVEGPCVRVDFSQEYQTIDGFGVSQADYADDVFIFPERETLLGQLFGEEGLRLNILRGEIFPHYSPAAGSFDFGEKSDISDQAVALAPELEVNDMLRRSQFWLSLYVARNYPDVLQMFTAWSPPAWMKEGGHSTEQYPASHGSLMHEHYQSYADYLTLFYKTFKANGIDIYALSPSNEPGYAAPWNSCLWTPEQMGEFIHDYMLPTFEANDVEAKAIFGENPSWSVTSKHFEKISSELFVDRLLSAEPDMDPERVIAAGHAYELPKTLPLPQEELQNPIVPFPKAVDKGIHEWITEMSNIDKLTLSMEDALHWGASWSDYMTEAHVSAILWWLGAAPKSTNESLLVLDQKEGTIQTAKRYDVFGNWSRYIPAGSRCLGRTLSELPEDVKVSAFRNGKEYIVVVVNPGQEKLTFTLTLNDAKAGSVIKSYTTDAEHRWAESEIQKEKGHFTLSAPAGSVVTYTGQLR